MTASVIISSGSDVEGALGQSCEAQAKGVERSLEAKFCRQEFNIMSYTVAINHATVTTPILYASSVLTNANGQAGNAMLYGSTLICSLFFSTLIFGAVGSKKGLTLSMGLYSVYVLLFAVAAGMCDKFHETNGSCMKGSAYQLPVNLAGALVGTGTPLGPVCAGGSCPVLQHRCAAGLVVISCECAKG